MKNLFFCFSTLLLFFCFDTVIYACRALQPSAQTLVSSAEVVLRATAIKYSRHPSGDIRALHPPIDVEIEFKVEEVLKGKNVLTSLILNGYLTDTDDYNDRPVPYNFVRKTGRGGSCFAYEYKQGAEFLLFLVEKDGKFTLQPYALAPVNEQLRNNDKWLIWVKNELQTTKENKQK